MELVFLQQLSASLNIPQSQIQAVLKLLEEGNTVPFIARYRKEATGSLDEVQLRNIEEQKQALQELEDRRARILTTIESQDKLTPELKQRILQASTKAALEDLYLPYKTKRKTRATTAKQRGLTPLAERILTQPTEGNPEQEAKPFLNPEHELTETDQVLQGARDIIAEMVSESPEIRAFVRQHFLEQGIIRTEPTKDAKEQQTKFTQYYDFQEPLANIPSHRFLAIQRGEKEKVLRVHLDVEIPMLLQWIERTMHRNPTSPFAQQLQLAIQDGYKRLLAPSVETDVRVEVKRRSDREAVEIFA
ncbi:MAG: Tex-like N-terminal domain-containing protein, partial [Myxococcota bacterium]